MRAVDTEGSDVRRRAVGQLEGDGEGVELAPRHIAEAEDRLIPRATHQPCMVAHHCHGPGGVQGEEGTQGGQGKSRYLHGHSNLSSHNAKKRIHSSSGIVSDTIAVGIGMTQGRHLAEKRRFRRSCLIIAFSLSFVFFMAFVEGGLAAGRRTFLRFIKKVLAWTLWLCYYMRRFPDMAG